MEYSQRVMHLKAEGAYQVLAKAQELEAQGREIIHLEIGEPDFPTPENVREAGKSAIDEGRTKYNPPRGIKELREMIAEDAAIRKGFPVDAGEVVIGPGAKPHLFFPTLALVEPGDEVIYPNPGFPTYEAMIQVAGGVPVPIPLLEEKEFAFDLELLEEKANPKTRLILINSPSNPTGGVLPQNELEKIAEIALKNDAWVLSDEIYSRIVYDEIPDSIAAIPGMKDRTVICDGFSKTYSMTGWRLGYGIMPPGLADRVQLLLTHSIGCTASFTQYAGIEAVTGDQSVVDEMVATYRQRRDLLVQGLNDIPGVRCQNPAGAFYVFPNITSFGLSSEDMANYLMDECGVALLPGTAFGKYGQGFLRLCFATSTENISKAIDLMKGALAKL